MTESCDAETWEDLAQLSLNTPSPPTTLKSRSFLQRPLDVACVRRVEEDPPLPKDTPPSESADPPKGDSIDQALKEALKNPRERANVLRIDADVFKFISDKTRCTIEFSYDLTSYQRLLAHRVSQMYGLQTSSVPLGNGLSRVIAHKTQSTKAPPVRVVEVMDIYCPPETVKRAAPPEVTIKRREGAAGDGVGEIPCSNHLTQTTAQGLSVQQREEEYKAARQRILGETPKEGDEQVSPEEPEEDGKHSKAVFRDREKELQDPDYRRAAKCYQKTLYEDRSSYGNGGGEPKRGPTGGGVYNVPTYQSEFPALPGGGPAAPSRPYPPYHPTEGLDRPVYPHNLPMNFTPRPAMNAVPFPSQFGFVPHQQTPYRMEPPAGTTQPMPAVWKFPSPVTTAPAPLARPPHVYGAFPQFPSFPGYPPYAARSPYITVAQGAQQVTTPMDGSHMHQMTTIRRRPMAQAHSEDRPPTDR